MAAAAATARASDPRWREAQMHLLRGHPDAARRALTGSPLEEPRGVLALLLEAQIAWREDRIRDAAAHALAAAEAGSDDPETLCAVAANLLEIGEVLAARACLEHPALAASRTPRVLMRLAGLRRRLEEHAEALALLDRARAAGHDTPALAFRRGEELMFNGRLDEAEAELAGSLARAPAYGRVAVPLVRLRRQTSDHNHLALIERSLRIVAQGSADHAAIEFARYKTFEDLGRYGEAWDALAHGNALMYARLRDEADHHNAGIERFLERCSPGILRPAAETAEGPQPIFIIGMPRSGSTLLERMLGNHSRVAMAGELPDAGSQLHWVADTRNTRADVFLARLPGVDYQEVGRRYLMQTQWRARGKAFFTDKHSPNWALAGVIHAALPRAPILNLVRDPMDTCFSNWRMFFGDASAYSYHLPALAKYCHDYRRALAHWHAVMPGAILDVSYAELVRQPEAALRKVFDFCGLDWEPGCADLARNGAAVSTPSAAQVRQSVHTRAFGEWRHYEQQLQPLREALNGHGLPVVD